MTVDWQPVDLPQAKDSRPDLETKPPASLVRRVRDVFRARMPPESASDVDVDGGHAAFELYRVVYVSRASAKDRNVVNEAELIESLRRKLDLASRAEVIGDLISSASERFDAHTLARTLTPVGLRARAAEGTSATAVPARGVYHGFGRRNDAAVRLGQDDCRCPRGRVGQHALHATWIACGRAAASGAVLSR